MIGCVKLFGGRYNKGDFTEITYFDETDEMVDPENASRIRIRELLADGTVISETWSICGRPIKKPA